MINFDPRQTLLEFLRIPSVTGNEGQAGEFLYHLIQKLFLYDHLEKQIVAPGRFNLLMTKGKPQVLLTSHIDTVPGGPSAEMRADRIIGRGACDAKGQVIAQLAALAECVNHGLKDYGCFYVVGEEVDNIGAQRIVADSQLQTKYLINGEPTGNKLVKSSMGVIEARIYATSEEVHSSILPNRSAIHKLVDSISRVLAQESSYLINVGKIFGGTASNTQAGRAEALLCVRFSDSSENVIKELNELFNVLSLEIISPPLEACNFYIPEGWEGETTTVAFGSDAPLYRKIADNLLLFGPGSINVAHSEEEYLAFEDLSLGIEKLCNLLRLLR